MHKYSLKIEKQTATTFKFHNIDAKTLPPVVDLRNKCPPIYNQLQLGSCTANALVACFQYDDMKFYGSRLFLYYNERYLDNNVYSDAGSTLSQGIRALKKYGLCSEKLWTYSDNGTKFMTKPSKQCYTEALNHQVLSATNISPDLISMKKSLASNEPFVLGILIYESFETDNVSRTGIVPMPQRNESILGGHAILCVGYDDTKSMFIMRNSWGTNWGDNGYFYIPYEYITNSNLASDFWNITKIEIPKSKPNKKQIKDKTKPNINNKKNNKINFKTNLDNDYKSNINLILFKMMDIKSLRKK